MKTKLLASLVAVFIAVILMACVASGGDDDSEKALSDKKDASAKKEKSEEQSSKSEKGKIEIWVNGKKLVDKSWDSDNPESETPEEAEKDSEELFRELMKKHFPDFKGFEPGNLDETFRKFVEKHFPELEKPEGNFDDMFNELLRRHFPEFRGRTAVDRKSTNADIRVITEDGKQQVWVNGTKMEVKPGENGSVSVQLDVDSNGKATLKVNGEKTELPEGRPFGSGITIFPPMFGGGFNLDDLNEFELKLRRRADSGDTTQQGAEEELAPKGGSKNVEPQEKPLEKKD